MLATLEVRLPVAGFFRGLGPIASPLPFLRMDFSADRLRVCLAMLIILHYVFGLIAL